MNKQKTYFQMNSRDGGLAFTLMMFLYVFITFVGQSLVSSIVDVNSSLYVGICSLFPAISITVVAFYYIINKNFGAKAVLNVQKFDAKFSVLAVCLAVGMFLGLGFINSAFQQLLIKLGLNVVERQLSFSGFGDLLIYVFALAVIPAIFEEIFFRGLILNSFSGANKVVGVVLTSLCFALYHGSATQFFYQFLYGVGFCVLALALKSVVPCIIAHFINNFAIILLTYFNVQIDLFNPLLIVVGILLLIGFSLSGWFLLKKEQKEKTTQKASEFFIPFGIMGVLVCLLLIVVNLIPVA